MLTVVTWVRNRRKNSRNTLCSVTLNKLAFLHEAYPPTAVQPKPGETWLVRIDLELDPGKHSGGLFVTPISKIPSVPCTYGGCSRCESGTQHVKTKALGPDDYTVTIVNGSAIVSPKSPSNPSDGESVLVIGDRKNLARSLGVAAIVVATKQGGGAWRTNKDRDVQYDPDQLYDVSALDVTIQGVGHHAGRPTVRVTLGPGSSMRGGDIAAVAKASGINTITFCGQLRGMDRNLVTACRVSGIYTITEAHNVATTALGGWTSLVVSGRVENAGYYDDITVSETDASVEKTIKTLVKTEPAKPIFISSCASQGKVDPIVMGLLLQFGNCRLTTTLERTLHVNQIPHNKP